jgi:hypothetical protein
MTTEQQSYLAYMLRLWQVSSDRDPIWRASVESLHSGERHGFANLQMLFAFLEGQTGGNLSARSSRKTSARIVGWTHVMNLTDLATGIKMGSYVHPAGSPQKRHLIPWEQMRANLRLAFSRWGLPDRIRTDRDQRLVAPGEYPVPMPFTV